MNPLLLDIPDQLTTERLILRRYQAGNGRAYFQAIQANLDHLHEFLPPELITLESETDAEIKIRELMADWQMRRLFLFGLWHKETGTYIGETYLANADWQVPCIELGYFLLKDYTGRGFATEAAQGAIRFAFEFLQVTRIELQCNADNQASMNVAIRFGFQQEKYCIWIKPNFGPSNQMEVINRQ